MVVKKKTLKKKTLKKKTVSKNTEVKGEPTEEEIQNARDLLARVDEAQESLQLKTEVTAPDAGEGVVIRSVDEDSGNGGSSIVMQGGRAILKPDSDKIDI